MSLSSQPALPEESICYCINPFCDNRKNPEHLDKCHACGTPLYISDRYRLLAPLRPLHGGYPTEIFEVEDWGASGEDFGKRKAIKIVTSDKDSETIGLLKQEFRALTYLQHPSIPKVQPDGYFTVRINKKGKRLHCLVMELIEGISLEQWLEKPGKISQTQAIEWLYQLVKILDYLHNKGFFHQDIKPGNIMHRPDGQLVLIDWGTVRELSPTYLDKLGLRGVTPVVSQGYTAPEQKSGEAIPKSDFFALGRTLVHLLTGKHPMVFESSESKLLLNWRDDCQIDNWFADLIEDLINPISLHRPQNTQVILQRLEVREGDHRPLFLLPNPTFATLPKVGKKPIRRGVAAGAIASLLCLGLPVAAPQIAIASNQQGMKYHSAGQWQQAEFFYKLSLVFNSEFAKAHYNFGALSEKLGNIQEAKKQYELAVKYGDLAAAYNNLAHLLLKEQNYPRATELLLNALKLSQWDQEKYAILKNLGFALLKQERALEAETYLQEAIALAPNRPEAYCVLAQVKSVLGGVGERTHLAAKKCGETLILK